MNPASLFLITLLIGLQAFAQTAQVREFTSPNQVIEECYIIPPLPVGDYDKDDHEEEELYCSLDFYDSTKVALCPKTWSTSPGTMVYDISESAMNQAQYEAQASCGGSKKGHKRIAKFKQTMNQKGTSGTYAPSSLLYYHLSRYFDTAVKVPVAVMRTIDKEEHFKRVTKKAHERKMGKGEHIRAGWDWLYRSEQNPSVYDPMSDLFTDDGKQIYGALVDGGGERYGAEINGIRSKWGDAQNIDFQNTPAFLALRSEAPLLEAIKEGLSKGQRNAEVKKDMGGGASDFQMAVWMKELSEIVLLDYILNQQDRIGNIDYKWYIYYVDEKGKVKDKKLDTELPRAQMNRISYPKDVKGSPTILVQRSRINDNDAGARAAYTNYAKRTKMLENIRHMSRKTFDLLMALNDDFEGQGPIYTRLKSDFFLSESSFNEIVSNTKEAAGIVKGLADSGKLRLDLDSVKNMYTELVK